jgi:lysozyme family protein
MASFDVFLPIVLGFEGGYSDDPTDPGGETNKGITMAVFRHCCHPLLGIEPTSANLKALTDGQAGIIYKALYWAQVQGDSIQLQDLANIVCDFYVNAGTHATTLLQHVLNDMGAHLVEDGSIGPATLQALGQYPDTRVYNAFKQGRIAYYRALGSRFPQFLKGWLNRANSFPDLPAIADDALPISA